MNESLGPSVALLFDDTELGAHLRQALEQRGARIVHEGGVAGFDQAVLDRVDADVLVVNLDDTVEDALDNLYDLFGGDRPRVVFNDAAASRHLDGWDRARWARHLAVKVMAEGDFDPPRPDNARGLDLPDPAVETSAAAMALAADGSSLSASSGGDEASVAADESGADTERKQVASAESETLAAELEALLLLGDLPDSSDAQESTVERDYGEDESLLEFDQAPSALSAETAGSAGDDVWDDSLLSERVAEVEKPESTIEVAAQQADIEGLDMPVGDVGDMTAGPPDEQDYSLDLASAVEAAAAMMTSMPEDLPAKPASISAPTEWALLDDTDVPQDSAVQVELSDDGEFGVEKLSATEYLAPDVEIGGEDVTPTMSLELVSLEDSVAPQAWQPDHEMVLDDTGTALSRIILLGATATATESVAQFLAALPGTTRLTFLLVQHLDAGSAPSLLAQLSGSSSLPVRMAEDHGVARAGEVLVAPPELLLSLRRDGRISTAHGVTDGTSPSQSIDACLTMAAGAFGRDALAIVFAGNGTDAVGGCQAVHDRGGRVWVESAPGDYSADMVSGIFAEQLVDFSGTPQDLAAHLIEVFP